MYRRYGPLVKENIGGKVIVHVFDPEDIKTVYTHEGKYPVVPPLQETTQVKTTYFTLFIKVIKYNNHCFFWFLIFQDSKYEFLEMFLDLDPTEYCITEHTNYN